MADIIDAVEVYNGNWLGDQYVQSADTIVTQLGVDRAGSRHAHEVMRLMACYAQMPDPVRSTEDVVTAIKQLLTVPRWPGAPRKGRRHGIF